MVSSFLAGLSCCLEVVLGFVPVSGLVLGLEQGRNLP